jgi:hypothetical protein
MSSRQRSAASVSALVGYLGAFGTERNVVMSLGSAVRGALGRWEPVAIRAYRGAFIDLACWCGGTGRAERQTHRGDRMR